MAFTPNMPRGGDGNMAGLYIVATPIGNLRDMTFRAVDILRAADRVLAEDTRRTGKLLDAFDISATLTPYHDHNVAARIPQVLKWLAQGQVVALVSDAGTPLISDPGFKLVRAAIEHGIDVFPLPGASAVMAGLVKSGLPCDRFLFSGFLPAKTKARQKALADLKDVPSSLIFFETGPRIAASLGDMHQVLGERDVALTRELTKQYEEARRGSFSDVIASVKSDPPRGEIVVVLGPPAQSVWDETRVLELLSKQVGEMGVKRASAVVAAQSGWPSRDVYALALTLKKDTIKKAPLSHE